MGLFDSPRSHEGHGGRGGFFTTKPRRTRREEGGKGKDKKGREEKGRNLRRETCGRKSGAVIDRPQRSREIKKRRELTEN
jgi:hypothetical protein